jgi:hypothetical protein
MPPKEPNSHPSEVPKGSLSPFELRLLAWIRELSPKKLAMLKDIFTDAEEMTQEGFGENDVLQYIKRNYMPWWD